MTDKEFDAAAEALRIRLDQKFDDAYEQLFANPKLTGRKLDKAIDSLYAQRDREEEAELEKLEELRDQQENEEFERLEELENQQEDEEFERLEELREQQEEAEQERQKAFRELQEEAEQQRLEELRDLEEDDDDELWLKKQPFDAATPHSMYSDGSRIVAFEDYSEADPNDYDPAEVDGGPENEDEYFDTGEEDDDYE